MSTHVILLQDSKITRIHIKKNIAPCSQYPGYLFPILPRKPKHVVRRDSFQHLHKNKTLYMLFYSMFGPPYMSCFKGLYTITVTDQNPSTGRQTVLYFFSFPFIRHCFTVLLSITIDLLHHGCWVYRKGEENILIYIGIFAVSRFIKLCEPLLNRNKRKPRKNFNVLNSLFTFLFVCLKKKGEI